MSKVLRTFDGAKAALAEPLLVQGLYDDGAEVMKDALITLRGEAHSKRRIMEFGVFKRGFFRQYERTTFPQTFEPLFDEVLARGEADLVEFGYRVVMNLTADFAGVDRTSASQTMTLLALVRKFSEGATLVHSTRDHAVVRGEVREAMSCFEEEFLQPSKQRRLALVEAFERGEVQQDELPRDVLTTLLKNRDRHPLPRDVVRREIAFYLQAGAHSTTNAVVRAMDEIFQWREGHPEAWAECCTDPLFIQRCVHESLRLYPASPVAWRRAAEALEVAGEQLADGELIELDLMSANRDETVFGPDAATFDPLRTTNATPFGLTFGYGVHACLGRDLDGGVVATASTQADEHQYGIVTLMVRRLLAQGAARHSERSPAMDANTVRNTWSSYPIQFREAT